MKPVLQALILAEKVYDDRSTGKKVIAGTFNTLLIGKVEVDQKEDDDGSSVSLVPGGMDAGSPCAYVSLTEVRADLPLVMRYVDLDDNRILMQCKFNVKGTNPLKTHELVIPLPKLPTPRLGVYALELLYREEPLGSLRVTVRGLQGDIK